MTPYLFLWNPKIEKGSVVDFDSIQHSVKQGREIVTAWVYPKNKPQQNDIIILARSGIENNGIFSKGKIATVAEYKDIDGKQMIELELDTFLPIGKEIGFKEIKERAQFKKKWNITITGNVIPDPLFKAINSIWKEREINDSVEVIHNTHMDILNIIAENDTTRIALINARIGKGAFRSDLIKIWHGVCAITGCSQLEILRASHSKPWNLSSNKERIDPNNGLLLSANYDAAFDSGLISISDDGTILISSYLDHKTRAILKLPKRIRQDLNESQKKYMKFHRQNAFQK